MIDFEVENLSYSYCAKETSIKIILPSLKLSAGQSVALTGVSGSGKSTLLECLALLRKDFKAQRFFLKERNLHALSSRECDKVRALLIGYMPQKGGLIPFLKLEDDLRLTLNLAKKAYLQVKTNVNDPQYFASFEDRFEESVELCKRLNIDHLLKRLPQELSEGQRQRASFVKAVCKHPSLLLMDEPTSALDPEHAHALFALMIEESARLNICTIAVTHDLKMVTDFKLRHLSYDEHLSSAKESIFTEFS